MDEQPTVRQAVPPGQWHDEDERRRPNVPGIRGAPEFQATVRVATPLRLPAPQLPPPTARRRRLPDRPSQSPTGDYTAYLDEDDGRRIPWGSLFRGLSAALVLVASFALPFADPRSPSAAGLLTHGKAIPLLITVFAAAAVLVLAVFSLLAAPKDGSGRVGPGFICFLVAVAAAYPLYDAFSATSSQVSALGSGFWLCVVGVAGMIVGSLATALNTSS